MPANFRKGLLKLFFSSLLISVTLPLYAADVIVNPTVQTRIINSAKAKAVFGGRVRRWPNNLTIKVFLYSYDSERHRDFCRDTLGIFPRQLQRAWDRQVFSGITEGPYFVESREEMLDMIRSVPGAIGYVDHYQSEEGVYVLDIR